MSTWTTVSFNFSPFEKLKPPVKSVLKILHTIEAVLEKLLALIKAFALDFLNPIRALIALLLAAIRTIINQLRATGFSLLLVHPDFGRQDIGAVLSSVAGSYPAFEQKLVSKFYDSSDIFRPTYPAGSSVGMVVFYIGAESPGDLLTQIFALLRFIRNPQIFTALPAPVDLKVRPVLKSDNTVAQGALILEKFSDLFDADFETSLALEWRMPMTPTGGNAPGFINSFVSFYNSFRFPSFVVERSELPSGETVEIEVSTPTAGKILDGPLARYGLKKPSSKVFLKEPDEATTYRHFSSKLAIGSGFGNAALIAQGALTGTYKFVDTFQDLKDADGNVVPVQQGKVYYYRVRAFFGKPTDWLTAKTSDFTATSSLVKRQNTKLSVNYGQDVVMGRASAITRGIVPRKVNSDFNLYNNVFDAVMAGIMLNFELPPADPKDSPVVKEQKTGWGCLAIIGGAIGPYKAALQNSTEVRDSFFVRAAVRRVVNQVVGVLYANVAITANLNQQWTEIKEVVTRLTSPLSAQINLDTTQTPGKPDKVDTTGSVDLSWNFPNYSAGDIASGFNPVVLDKINQYLSLESLYKDGQAELQGPFPLKSFKISEISVEATVEERQALAAFIGTALAGLGTVTGYLHWYSVTLGDLFPAFIPFIFDFEQFILALLKALESALKEIQAIIETLLQKIKQLEQILESILALIDLLSIKVSVSVLGYSDTNGSVDTLVEAIQSSEEKPFASPFGLHSGMVLTVGGPGQGSIQALKALAFILGISL